MNRKTLGRLAAEYMGQCRDTFLAFGLFTAVFAAVFFLYDLETEAMVYGIVICLLAGIGTLALGFPGFCRSHREREGILGGIEFQYRSLPPAGTLAEEDYQSMILALGEILSRNRTEWERERQESLDYYTTWVHQIKTPIAVMRMNLQGEDTKENRELLAELFRIEQYVEMVLSYIRLGSEESDLLIRRYRLDDIIRQAVRKYAPQFVRRRIRLIYEPTEAEVLTDEKWLLFILEQLLSNAVKYTPEGSVTIRVAEDKRLSVEDTGIGIAPEDLPRIFERGYTGYNGRADKKATGLGLNLCRKAAGRLGIGIEAWSQPGKGSRFTLDFRERELEIE